MINLNLLAVTVVSVILLVGPAAHGDGAIRQQADAVYLDARIYTSNPQKPWASELAIKDGRILYVGDKEGIAPLISSKTEQYQLHGKLVLPGMIDAHTHPGMVAMSTDNLVMGEANTREELFDEISKMVKNNPDRELFIGGYWPNELFDRTGPVKGDLDLIESARPVILYDAWAHSLWANSKALEIAGVNTNTPDLIPGLAFYQRDEKGEASGWITESASSDFINHFQKITPEVEKSLMGFLHYLRDSGVTTLLDAGNFGLDDEFYSLISRWDEEGILPLRYHGAYTLYRPGDLSSAVPELKRMRQAYGSDRVRIDTLKVFFDGVAETRTANMSEDYLDTPGNSGQSLLTEEQMYQLILDLHDEGLDMHVHAVGDQSIKMTLNAVEQAQQILSVPLNTQVTICHLEIMDDSDFNRFKDLGVIASFTPHWHGGDSTELDVALGQRSRSMMRVQPLISDGAIVTFSSDITDISEWKDDRANPFVGMQIAHNKQEIEGGAEAFLTEPRSERLSLTALVDGYTRHAALQLGRADQIGSIEAGKRADFVVLDKNLFEVDRYEVSKIKPQIVVMDGKVVYQKND